MCIFFFSSFLLWLSNYHIAFNKGMAWIRFLSIAYTCNVALCTHFYYSIFSKSSTYIYMQTSFDILRFSFAKYVESTLTELLFVFYKGVSLHATVRFISINSRLK